MKTYTIRDWTMIMISFSLLLVFSVSFSTYAFSGTERTKSLLILR
jgi:hypothetical protein